MNEIRKRFCLFAVTGMLLAMLLFSPIRVTKGSYKTSVSGSAKARVARFDVTVSDPVLLSDDAILEAENENDSIQYRFLIENKSEVDIGFTVVAETEASVNIQCIPEDGILSSGESTEVLATVSLAQQPMHAETVSDIRFSVTAEQIGEELAEH